MTPKTPESGEITPHHTGLVALLHSVIPIVV